VVYVADRSGNWFDLTGHVVLAHAVIGLFGWLGLAYVSVAEKLWPMFFLAHIPGRHRAGQVAVRAVPAGVVLLSPGLLTGLPWLAWARPGPRCSPTSGIAAARPTCTWCSWSPPRPGCWPAPGRRSPPDWPCPATSTWAWHWPPPRWPPSQGGCSRP